MKKIESSSAFFEALKEFKREGKLDDIDLEVINSMFNLDEKALSGILLRHGFTLPKNDRPFANIDAVWELKKGGQVLRSLTYVEKSWDTMYGRSDHYHIDIEYATKEDLKATYRFRRCEENYGRTNENENRCAITKNGKTVLEFVEP